MDDLTHAKLIHERDSQALDLLVERHHSPLYRFLLQLTRNQHDAEDLTQQTLLRAIAGAMKFDGRAGLRAWLLGIAFHEFTRHRRKQAWLPLIKELAISPKEFDNIGESEALRVALLKLKPENRAIFLMHHVEEIPLNEIAASLQIPEGTVKSRLFTARTQLRNYLEHGENNYVPETC